MEKKILSIRAEEVKSRLLHRQPLKERFRLALNESDMYNYLLGAVMAEVESRRQHFEMTKDLQDQLTQMAKYLTSDSRKFGIILIGGCGNGKTTLIRAFQRLLNMWQIPCREGYERQWAIQIISAKEVISQYRENPKQIRNLFQRNMLAIDDLGTEAVEIMNFGNVETPITDIISKRYDEQKFTIFSTNLAVSDIRSRYGIRIADRFNEMCKKITFPNSSYRMHGEKGAK